MSIPICLPGGRGCNCPFGGTDGQTNGIDFGMYSQRPFEWYMTRLPKLKISWRRGKECTSPVTLGGRHNYRCSNSCNNYKKKNNSPHFKILENGETESLSVHQARETVHQARETVHQARETACSMANSALWWWFSRHRKWYKKTDSKWKLFGGKKKILFTTD